MLKNGAAFFVTDSSWTNFWAGPEFFDTSAYM